MRPIDGDALKERLQSLAYDDWNQGVSTTWANAYSEVADMIDDFPSADVREVKRGRWIHDGYDIPHGVDWMHCAECGKREPYVPAAMTNYCPNCGADMRKEE